MGKQLTAVEWFLENLRNLIKESELTDMRPNEFDAREMELLKQAKEMEEDKKKELVIATYTYLKMKDCQLPYGMQYLNKISELDDEAEQYYNETYK